MIPRRWLWALVLLLIAVFSWWLLRQVQTTADSGDNDAAHQRDYYFEDFVITAMDQQGKPRHRLRATSMSHFPDNGSNEVTAPDMEIYAADSPPWQVSAERGWVSSEGKDIRLLGKVSIQRAGAAGIDPVQLWSTDLHIRPDSKYAETSGKVRVISTGIEVESIGMRAFLDEGRVELLSRVRGKYETRLRQ